MALNPERIHQARIRTGVFIGSYQVIALAVDNPDLVPRITDLSHRWPWLGRGIAAWCVAHLAIPTLYPWCMQLLHRTWSRIVR